MDLSLLKELDFTESEINVYKALVKLGSSTVGPIINEADIASSKVYELLDKLIDKGLVTYYLEGKTKYFKPVDPNRLLDYIKEKEKDLKNKEEKLKNLMPQLKQLYEEQRKDIEVELFKGYKGVKTAFQEMINELEEGEELLVIGGGDKPTTNQRTKIFFENIHRKRSKKGIILRIIFSEARRESYKNMRIFPHTNLKYLSFGTPSTINIYKNTTILLTMSPEPAAIRIKDKNITESYRIYFEKMWDIAKK